MNNKIVCEQCKFVTDFHIKGSCMKCHKSEVPDYYLDYLIYDTAVNGDFESLNKFKEIFKL